MLGVALSFYKEPLKHVPAHVNKKPDATLNVEDLVDVKEYSEYIEYYGDMHKDLKDQAYRLPLRLFKNASFDALCKIRISSFIMMDESVENIFKDNLQYRLFHKITSSMWRWGCNRGLWNDIVDFYNYLRTFKFDRPEFSVRLDYTTYINERGRSEHTSTYLDGPLAYLVYYKGKHVMTIGFAIMANRRILIQQVQLKEPKGNRWLYKLPPNYLAYILDLFKANFPRHRFFIVSGADLVESYISDYKQALKANGDNIEWANRYYQNDPKRWDAAILSYEKDRERIMSKLENLRQSRERLTKFYANTGHHQKASKPMVVYGMHFYKLQDNA